MMPFSQYFVESLFDTKIESTDFFNFLQSVGNGYVMPQTPFDQYPLLSTFIKKLPRKRL